MHIAACSGAFHQTTKPSLLSAALSSSRAVSVSSLAYHSDEHALTEAYRM